MNQAFEPACTPIAPPWEAPQVIPAQLRRVDNLIFRKIGLIARTNGVEAVTPMHGWIMEYLYRHSETPVFQRDIEREFSITRSTVTNILQLMERKGYITRRSVEQDARLKQLVLTEKGRQQARELGRKVKESGVHIDEILYSPLSRAADTAKAVAKATGLPARCEPRLREQCFGKYEGTPRDGAEFRISKTHFADRYDGGESMMQLAQRIYNLLDELRQDENKTYLLVAHNGIARVVESYFHDMTNEEYSAAGIKNCELVEYHFE